MKFSFYLTFLFTVFLILPVEGACASFEAGNELYFQERYEDALEEYQKCLDNEVFSLFYNMANTYYKLKKFGLAKLYYEKAKLLSPNERNLIYNLDILAEKLIDEEDSHLQIHLPLSKTSALQVLFLLSLVGSVLFLRRNSLGPWGYRVILIAILSFIVYARHAINPPKTLGIITSQRASLYSNRNLSSAVTAKIHEGKSLRILEEGQAWLLVELGEGVKGWIPRESVGRI